MFAPMNHDGKRSGFTFLKRGAIALGVLLIFTVLATAVVIASSPAHSKAAAPASTSSSPLKNITQLGLAGPGGVVMTSAQFGWAYGTNNVQHTSDGGHTWQVVAKGTANQVIRPFFVLDGQAAWYTVLNAQTGATTVIARTNNGGQSWSRFRWISPTQFLNSISIPNHQNAWVNTVDTSGSQPVFHLYLVGGSPPWQEVSLPNQNQVGDIHFISQKVGWVVTVSADGTTEELNTTRDGGQSWMPQTLPLPANVPATDTVSIQFLGFGSSQTGFLTAHYADPTTGAIDSNQVYKTSDGGQSWFLHGVPVPNNLQGIAQIDSWQITTAQPEFASVINLGTLQQGQWTVQSTTLPPGNLNGTEFTGLTSQLMFDSSISADGTTQELFESQDGGATWNQIATIPFTV